MRGKPWSVSFLSLVKVVAILLQRIARSHLINLRALGAALGCVGALEVGGASADRSSTPHKECVSARFWMQNLSSLASSWERLLLG